MVSTHKKWSTVKRKLFEMFLKTIDWKLIWKFCVTIICGLHVDRTSRISVKNMMKNIVIIDTLVHLSTIIKNIELLKGWRTLIR